MISATFVLADLFDVISHSKVPDEVFELEQGITTCLACDGLAHIEAINQFYEDIEAPCAHCKGEVIVFISDVRELKVAA